MGTPPAPLPRNAPVGPRQDHIRDPLLSPGRDPLDLSDLLQPPLAQVVLFHRDEPLLGGADEGGILAPPAVGVGVGNRPARQKMPPQPQVLDDLGIGLP